MGTVVTLELPRDLAERAQQIAEQTRRSVEEVLLDWLGRGATDAPVELLTNEQVLALRDLQMSADEQAELNDLLERQREGDLDTGGRDRLDYLMKTYRRGMILKAQAIKVAVERGLQPPLHLGRRGSCHACPTTAHSA